MYSVRNVLHYIAILCSILSYVVADIAQLVRASDCGSEGRRFETGYSPH